jgi:micrococcal nuclease
MGRTRLPRAPLAGALLFLWAALALAAHERAAVRWVIDGDTVVLADGRHVRLIGINAPERAHDQRPAEPLADEGTALLKELAEGRTVYLGYEAERFDRHGRTLAHLAVPETGDPQLRLLQAGLAFAIAVPPNLDRLGEYVEAENGARARGAGVWSNPYYAPRRADTLGPDDTGFRFVSGRIQRVGRSRRYVYLDLAPNASLRVSHGDWERYWRGEPEDWLGREVVARGWLVSEGARFRLRLHHPTMMVPAESW